MCDIDKFIWGINNFIPFGAKTYNHFSRLHNPRLNRNKKHNLTSIIALIILAVISGAEYWYSIEDWLKKGMEELRPETVKCTS
jgi:hypothetical protein